MKNKIDDPMGGKGRTRTTRKIFMNCLASDEKKRQRMERSTFNIRVIDDRDKIIDIKVNHSPESFCNPTFADIWPSQLESSFDIRSVIKDLLQVIVSFFMIFIKKPLWGFLFFFFSKVSKILMIINNSKEILWVE